MKLSPIRKPKPARRQRAPWIEDFAYFASFAVQVEGGATLRVRREPQRTPRSRRVALLKGTLFPWHETESDQKAETCEKAACPLDRRLCVLRVLCGSGGGKRDFGLFLVAPEQNGHLADVLHEFRSGGGGDALYQLDAISLFRGNFHLDQLVRVECAGEFLQNRIAQPVLTDPDYRFEMVGQALEVANLFGGERHGLCSRKRRVI